MAICILTVVDHYRVQGFKLKVENAELKGETGAYIKFSSNTLGHVFVQSELRDSRDFTQILRLGFRADQTCLALFISRLEKSLDTPLYL